MDSSLNEERERERETNGNQSGHKDGRQAKSNGHLNYRLAMLNLYFNAH